MRSRCHPRPRSVLLVAAVALWLSLVGCSSGGGIVDHTKLEEGIAKQAAAGNLTVTAVVCPEGRPLIEGDTFTCRATLDSGEVITIDATQSNAKGDITLKQVETVITGEKFAATESGVISREYDIVVTLECPARIVVKDGDTFTCQGTDDRGHTRTVVFTAVHGNDGEFTHVVDGLPPPSTTTTTAG